MSCKLWCRWEIGRVPGLPGLPMSVDFWRVSFSFVSVWWVVNALLTKNGEASTLESNRPDPFAFAIDGLPDRFDDHRLVDSASKRGTL